MNKKRRTPSKHGAFLFAARLGLEPRLAEPETAVLPLDDLAIKDHNKILPQNLKKTIVLLAILG